ncbi:MAG: HAD family phosphatase [Deltaproteobacteria bacterium]|nr:HAD family phosphatase [Deltaproteobacteria bacterium]
MQIRAVLFDFGGVFTPSPFGALDTLAEELGADPELMMEVIFGPYGADTDHPWHRLERGELSFFEARDEILALGKERGVEADPIQLFTSMDHGSARPELVDRVRSLRDNDLRTALVTNNVKEFSPVWRKLLPVDELFDVVIDSSEVGIRKPDPRIFHLALERLGIEPHEALFLDDYADNIRAAEALGIRGVLVEDDPSSALAVVDTLL